jgi:aspartyl aminopeptidase
MEEKEQNEPNLMFEKKFAFDVWDEATTKKAFDFCEGYKEFLDLAKTEQKTVDFIVSEAKKAGFESIGEASSNSTKGFKTPVYLNNRNRAIILARPGKKPISEGFRFIMSHGDSNHLDLKPKPLYESEHVGFLKTQYYGGIRKYQWPTIPLAIYGKVIKQDGTAVEIEIGDKSEDPIFMITDLLPHLAKQQDEKKLSEAIPAETMNVIIGSISGKGKEEEKELVKKGILSRLNQKYGITEEDFVSSDLQIVPAGPARDVGFDRALISAYAQDDRSCVYTSLKAILDVDEPEYPTIFLCVDKEETGSIGNTGAQSSYIIDFISELVYLETGKHDENLMRDSLSASKAISADTTGGFDPDYAEVFDPTNAPRIGAGVVVEKFTSTHGKYSTNEASGEFTAFIRKIFNKMGVNWQTGGAGKVDIAWGGLTIAYYLASFNMDIIDIGPALFSVHAPLEIASKADIYSTYLAYKAFFEAN